VGVMACKVLAESAYEIPVNLLKTGASNGDAMNQQVCGLPLAPSLGAYAVSPDGPHYRRENP
jgi:hypothetical protein